MPAMKRRKRALIDSSSATLERSETLWLPDPQPRAILGPMPGKREDGILWFEGPRKTRPQADEVQPYHRISLPPGSPKPRDFRRGDKWLPWH